MPSRSNHLLLVLGLVATGCAGDLPIQERIASTRPLAARIEIDDPGLPEGDPIRVEALPFETARLTPWLVDEVAPLESAAVEAVIEPIWIACTMRPLVGLGACLLEAKPLELGDLPDCVIPDPGDLDPSAIPEVPSPCRMTEGTPGQPELTVPLDFNYLLGGDIEVTMIGHEPNQSSTGECADALLSDEATIPGGCIFAAQRLPVGPDYLLLQMAEDLGIELPGEIGPIPDEIPDPDSNPRIISFDAIVINPAGEQIGEVAIARGDTLVLNAGDSLEITTEAPEGDLQTYLIPIDNTDFAEESESYEGLWFRTWGTLLSDESNDPVSVNAWTLERGEQDEDDAPPDGRATLYYVLRDGRQGVDWWWFHVNVMP